MAKSVLIVFSHPAYYGSRANRALRKAVEGLEGVTIRDLYETYPDFLVDIIAEQALLADHDHIVMMHPFYWYSVPALMKEWQDLVLEYGWAYGEGGTKLAGKTWTHVITTGGPNHSYKRDGLNRFTMDELLRPYEATAHLCQCSWQKPFIVHGSRQASIEDLAAAGAAFKTMLEGLING